MNIDGKSGNSTFDEISIKETAEFCNLAGTPANASTDKIKLYSKAGTLAYVNDVGTEVLVSGGGGALPQPLDTTDSPTFNNLTLTGDLINTVNSQQYSTGVLTGGNVTITAPGVVVFSISAGTGVIVDLSAGTHTTISWAAIVNQNISTLTANEAIHIFYFDDSSGVVKEQLVSPTPIQRRDRVYVGGLSLDPTFAVVIEATTLARMAVCPNNNLSDLAEVIGPVNTGGNLVSSASLLTFKKDLGNVFSLGANWAGSVKNPNIVAVPEMDSNGSDTFVIAYQTNPVSADIDIHTLSATSVIPAQYDQGLGAGSPGTVNNNEWTVMRVLVTVGGTVILMTGQQKHSSIDDAIAATGQGTVPSTLLAGSVTVAFLVVKGNLVDFSNDNNSRIIQASKFGTGGSGSSISNMQNIYDNSTQPQVETSALGAVQYKNGQASNSLSVLEVLSNTSDTVCEINGLGNMTLSSTAPALLLLDTNSDTSANQRVAFLDQSSFVMAQMRMLSGDLEIANFGTDSDLIFVLNGDGAVIPDTTDITDIGGTKKFKDVHLSGQVNSGTIEAINPAGSDLATVFTVKNNAGDSRFSIIGSGFATAGPGIAIKDYVNTGSASSGVLTYVDSAATTIASISTDTSDISINVVGGSIKTNTQAYSEMNTLSNAATILSDMTNGNVHQITLTNASSILGAPSNLRSGATYIFIFTQGSASRLLTYNSIFTFPSGSVPTLSVVSGAIDVLSCVYNGTSLFCSLSKSFS